MPIGNVQLTGTPMEYSSPNVSRDAFGEGVGTALRSLAATTADYEQSRVNLELAAKEDQRRQQRFDSSVAWTRLEGQMAREQVDAINAAPENGAGLTDSRLATLREQQKAFLDTIEDPELRQEFEADTEAYIQSLTTATYGEEYKLRTNYESTQLSSTVDELTSNIVSGRTSLEAGLAQFDEVLTSSRLSPTMKEELRKAAAASLGAAQFQRNVQEVMSGRGTVREATGEDVVAAGLLPWERGFLNATAARESGGRYDIRYDGGAGSTFTDFSDHPRVYVPGPDGMSSAAGRYMITASTWDHLVETYGRDVLPDFSPESQDRAALLLARERFNAQLGPGEWDFDTLMARGTDEQLIAVKKALAPTWRAFDHMSDQEFLNIFRGGRGVSGGGTGSGTMPDAFTDPRFADLPYDVKVELAGQAQSAVNSMRAAAEQQRKDTADMLRAQFAAGAINSSVVQDAITNGKVTVQDAAQLTTMIRDDMDKQREASRFASAVDGGLVLGNTEENQKAASEFYRRSGTLDALQNGDMGAAQILARGFATTGVLPKEVGTILTAMANSNNPRQTTFAMDALALMRAKNPDMFAFSLPKDVVEMEAAWSTMRRYSPMGGDAKLLEDFQLWRSPEGVKQREVFEKDIKEFLATMPPEEIAAAFDQGMFDLAPSAPASPAAQQMLKADYDQMFRRYYPLFQDAETTSEFVVQQLSNSWQQDSTGGTERLMYLGPTAPTSGYAPINGSYDWVRQDIITSLGLPEDAEFTLIADPQSEADIAAGRPASYLISMPDANGSWSLQMDPDNPMAPRRFRPTITPELRQAEQNRLEYEAVRGQYDMLFRQTTGARYNQQIPEGVRERLRELEMKMKELRGTN